MRVASAASVSHTATHQLPDRNKNPPCAAGLKPSDGLEPSTPSLPCAAKPLPWVATGCRSACLSRFRGSPICHRLPPVASAGLHKCSIPAAQCLMGRGVPALSCRHLLCREGVESVIATTFE